MDTLKYIYNLDRRFFGILCVWVFLVITVAFSYSSIESFQLINSLHHPIADYFFSGITHVGDGLFIVILGLVLIFLRSGKLGTAVLATYIFSGLISAALKRVFDNPRPAFFLADDSSFHSLPWVPLAYHHSFPSGHTTSAFAAATTFALFCANRKLSFAALILACMAAYSRVYLGQHFVEDLWFGTMLGSGTAVCCYLAYRAVLMRSFQPLRWVLPSFKV